MDPNATLLSLRDLAAKMMKDYENPDSNGIDQDDANALAEGFNNLDEWIKKGGFLPHDWDC